MCSMEPSEVEQEAARKVAETVAAGKVAETVAAGEAPPKPAVSKHEHRKWEFVAAVLFPLVIIAVLSTAIWYHDWWVRERFGGPEKPIEAGFQIEEATIGGIQYELQSGRLTSRALVQYYLNRIALHDPLLHSIIELNPDALAIADAKDKERALSPGKMLSPVHGIPILVKDNIGTRDKMNTTAGSLALVGSVVARDSSVVAGLRAAGMILLGKANMNEWAGIRATDKVIGWSARGGTIKNPYVLTDSPCGSSGGSAVAVAANLVTVALGTETDGSILCPSSAAAMVGIKPSVGVTSRSGVVPLSLSQDSVGPMARTLQDAVLVLDAIVSREVDPTDPATARCHHLLPTGSYSEFLNTFGCQGKRIGYVGYPFWTVGVGGVSEQELQVQTTHIALLEYLGATMIPLNLHESLASSIMNGTDEFPDTAERVVLLHDFKVNIESYLHSLESSPVKNLDDLVAFNEGHADAELSVMNQELFVQAANTRGLEDGAYLRAKEVLSQYVAEAVDDEFERNGLDAIIGPTSSRIYRLAAIGGYPGITIPSGFSPEGVPFGLTFIARSCMEPKLIEMASAFEAATMARKAPTFIGRKEETLLASPHGGMCANPDEDPSSCKVGA